MSAPTDPTDPAAARADPISVPPWIDRLGALVERHPRLWRQFGNIESHMLEDRIDGQAIERPIYVCGLARSGSTILLEILAAHAHTASHLYRDFPLVHTPYFWNRFLDRAENGPQSPVQRAHGDGMLVTSHSPEAMEEMLWMNFFPRLHQPGCSDVLDESTEAPEFEAYYRNHLRKLVWLRGGRRYLAKGNYNTTRIGFLRRLFADARFLVPVREPLAHVASLLRQHRRFCARHQADPRARRYMRRLGHFEFGLDRRAVHTGDSATAAAIAQAWDAGRDALGYALSWSALYGFVADLLERRPALQGSVRVVRHEDLCATPQDTLAAVLAHCGLPDEDGFVQRMAARLRPDAPHEPLTAAQCEAVHAATAPTAARFGYRATPTP